METPYEITNRWTKATALAAKLFAYKITAEKLDHIADEHWNAIAQSLEVNPPSPKCRAIVGQILVMFERAASEAEVKRNRAVREKRPMPIRSRNGQTA